jgi:hypothetical protein
MPSYFAWHGENFAHAFVCSAFWLWRAMAENDDSGNYGREPRGEGRGEAGRGDARDRARAAQAAREAERRAKVSAKLRENLMRRKSQARARRAGEADETQGLPASTPAAAKSDESS